MKIKVFQKGFNYSQDGDGNRLVYHLQGCNMYCPWCANPEGISVDGTLMVSSDRLLESVCPYGAITLKTLDRSKCDSCVSRECITSHKNMGIQLSCQEYELDAIFEEVKSSTPFFFDGGGVTLSGGEPTLQFGAIYKLLQGIKMMGIHTAIETNATHPELELLFPYIDLLITDFKHYDNYLHSRITGVGNMTIQENITKAFSKHKRVHIRIPVIRGFNDNETDIKNFSLFFKGLEAKQVTFEFLPYHEYGKIKWKQCGMNYKIKDGFISSEIIELYKKIFYDEGLKVIST